MAFIRKILMLCMIMAGALSPLFSLNFNSDISSEELSLSLVEEMTDEELLGQVMMIGYSGEIASPVIMDWIINKKIGGIKIFGWNANDLSVLADTIGIMQEGALSNRLEIPLIIATDQEGGWVRHIKGESSITPGNLALGASAIPYDSYQTGYYIALELKRLGINMNFAPTVDVYLNPLADVIGPRAFSQDPVQTGVLGTAFFKGMEEAGVIATAKHFPGHGNADEDSHGTLPVIPSDRSFLDSHDLIPYKMMIREGLPAIMAGHLAFPEITGDLRPASLCSVFLKEILRDELNYEGLVITDDLVMHGAQQGNKSLPEVCEEAIRAGSDFLLVSRSPEVHQNIWDHLMYLLKNDSAFETSMRIAAGRIIKIKADYLKREDHVSFKPDPSGIDQDIPAEASERFFFGQAARSTTVLRQSSFPIHGDSRVLIAGLYSDFRRNGELFFKGNSIRIPYSFSSSEKWQVIDYIRELAGDYDHIIFSLSRKEDLRVLRELEDLADKIVVISSLTPIYMNELPWVRDAVAVYGTGIKSYQAGFAAIRGDFIPRGRLPIDLLDNDNTDIDN